MPLRIVQSKQNARLKQLRKALANPARDLRSGAPHLAGIEGPNLLQEALRAVSLWIASFVAQGAERLLDSFKLPPQAEIVLLPTNSSIPRSPRNPHSPSPPLSTAGVDLGQASSAILKTPPRWFWSSPEFRTPATSAPSSAPPKLLEPPASSPSPAPSAPGNPKAVRASAGSVFRLPLIAASAIRLDRPPARGAAAHLRDHGRRRRTGRSHRSHRPGRAPHRE